MITSNIKTLLAVVVVLFINPRSYAGDWGAGNAGDTCEKRIGEIRDDIISWINKGAAKKLKLPANVTPEEYKTEMLRVMDKDYAVISCPDKKIEFENVEKTCVNYYNNEVGSHFLECDFSRFNKTDESKQYELIHHEYAGLAGFETNDGDVASDYTITNQISGYLVDVVVKKLSINPPEKVSDDSFLFGSYPSKYHCISDGYIVNKCFIPTLLEMDQLIQEFKDKINMRKELFENFKHQNDDLKKRFLQIAKEKELLLGENKFSLLYRSYVDRMDQMLEAELRVNLDLNHEKMGTYETVESYLSEESPYLKTLISLREKIELSITDKVFLETILSWDFTKAQSVMKKIEESLTKKFSNGLEFRDNFSSYVEMDRSCTELSGFGKLQTRRISLGVTLHPNPKYGFNLVKDQKLLSTLLTSNNGKPIDVVCKKVKRSSDLNTLMISFDKEDSTLTIPFYIDWGFGAIADQIGWEFKKSIIYHKDGHFHSDLRAELDK